MADDHARGLLHLALHSGGGVNLALPAAIGGAVVGDGEFEAFHEHRLRAVVITIPLSAPHSMPHPSAVDRPRQTCRTISRWGRWSPCGCGRRGCRLGRWRL